MCRAWRGWAGSASSSSRRRGSTRSLRNLPVAARAGTQAQTRLALSNLPAMVPFQERSVMRSFVLSASLAIVLVLPSGRQARAEVKLPSVFGSHMVVQRDKPLPVWGWGDAGVEVTVEFAGKTAAAKPDDKGAWKVTLP